MPIKSIAVTAALFVLSMLCVAPVFGQGVFTVSVSTTTAADIGAAELTGTIGLAVYAGTTVAASMAVHYSSQITNNSASEIVIRGTGGLRLVRRNPVWDKASNSIIFEVPAGGTPGDQLFIDGVRVNLLGHADDPVMATVTGVTAGANTITVGQNSIAVIDRIIPPYSVEWLSERPIAWENGQIMNSVTSIKISESFQNAFSSAVGFFGQTDATLIRIKPFPSLPPGVTLTYNAYATSPETQGFFNTLSGKAETVPRQDGSTDVIYRFSAGVDSTVAVETFPFSITADVGPPATTGTISFQTELLPIGTYPPNSQFPSKAIPRYTERYVPDEYDLIDGQTELAFPFMRKSSGTYTGLALTNPLDYRVNVTLAAYDETGKIILGPGIGNPTLITLPRNGQYARLAGEVFGPGLNLTTGGTIRAVGKTPLMTGFYLIGDENGPHLDGATADISPLASFVFTTVSHQVPSPSTLIELFNPKPDDAQVTLRLRDSDGQLVASAAPKVAAGGAKYLDLTALFPAASVSSFAGGYIECASDVPLVARETFGNAMESNVLGGQAPFQTSTFNVPHFATGGGNSTEISLLNLDVARQANLTLTMLDNNGVAIPVAGNPAKVTILHGKQLIETLQSLFPSLSADLTTGYIRVDVEPIYLGSFGAYPVMAGSVRFSAADGSSSAALPVRSLPGSNIVFSHVAQTAGFYTGVAVLNATNGPAVITLDVYKEDGTFVGTYSKTLLANRKMASLLYEMIPATAGQGGGYIRVHSTAAVTSFALFGTLDGRSLSAIPPQDAGDF